MLNVITGFSFILLGLALFSRMAFTIGLWESIAFVFALLYLLTWFAISEG